MSSRARPVAALLAAAATLAAAAPLRLLWRTSTWVPLAVAGVLVVAGVGMLARTRTRRPWLVVLAQLAGLLWLLAIQHLRGDLVLLLLPTPDALRSAAELLAQALHVVQSYAAPAPVTPGVTFALTLVVGLVALGVDLLAVTLRTPLAAGLPLLTAYVITAANRGEAMPWPSFAVPAVLWLLLLGAPAIDRMGRFGGALAAPAGQPSGPAPQDRLSRLGQLIGAGALAAAILGAAALPHLPPRFLTDGLGRSETARGGAQHRVSLSTTADLRQNLTRSGNAPVLAYTTTSDTPPPLRVTVLEARADGTWGAVTLGDHLVETGGLLRPEEAGPTARSQTVRVSVQDNTLAAPQLATPYPVTRISTSGARLTQDENLTLRTRQAPSSYRLEYLEPHPQESDLRRSRPQSRGGRQALHLSVPESSSAAVEAFVRKTVPAGADPLSAARAVQKRLRSDEFTYSTDVTGGSTTDPVEDFLRTKRGYCIHFAATMVLAARDIGVPARMAVGFLPGTRTGPESFQVRASDAHAWPELYFDGVGWLRFEPTPGGRSGAAPSWSEPPARTTSTATATDTTPTGSTPSATLTTSRPERTDRASGRTTPGQQAADRSAWQSVTGLGWPARALLLALVVGVLLTVLPLSAHLDRRAALRRAGSERGRTEIAWQSMLTRLADLGIRTPMASTPREAGTTIARDAYLRDEPAAALHRVVRAVEQARYGAAAPAPDVTADCRSVIRAAARGRLRSTRIRAVLRPQEGIEAWSRLLHRGRRH